MLGQAFGRQAVLARQVLHPGQASLQFQHGFRVQVEVVADAFEHRQRFVQLDRGRIQHRVDLGEAWFVAGFPLQCAAQLLQPAGQRVIAGQLEQAVLARLDQRGGMRMPAMAEVEFGERLGFQCFCLQFLQLMLQPRLALADIAAGEQGIALVAQATPCQRALASRLAQVRVARDARPAMPVWVVRASKACCSCWPWISTSSAVRSASWARVAGRPLIHAREPPSARRVRRSWQLLRPHRPGRRTRRPAASAAAAGASTSENAAASSARSAPWRTLPASARGAAQEAQRIDQQRLAGAGFAGDHGQPGTELEFGMGHDGKVANGQAGQHRRALCLLRRSTR